MEKRSLFQNIFGGKTKEPVNLEYLQMLNGFAPIFTSVKDIADTYLVKTCINTIATHGAKLEPHHIQLKGGDTNFIKGDIGYLLNVQPNPLMNTYSFLYKIISILYKDNNAFVFINKDDTGMIEGFYPIEAMNYELQQDKTGRIFLCFNFMSGRKTIPYEDIIHLRRFYNSHEIYGDSNSALKHPLDVANTALQGIDNAIKTSSYLRGILKFTQSMLKDKDLKKFKDDFVKDFMTIENTSGIAALDQKADFQEVNSKPITLDKDQLQYTKNNIYHYFNINEKIIEGNFTDDEWNAFFESVLEPLSIQLMLAFTTKIFNKKAIKEGGNRIVFGVNRIKYAKTDTKIKLLKELAILGLYTIDEARAILDMPPIGGEEGKKRVQTLNVVNADKADQYQIGDDEDGE